MLKIILFIVILFTPTALSGCEIDTRIAVSKENPPKFTFSGSGSIAQFFVTGPYTSEEIKTLSQGKGALTKEDLKKLIPGDRSLWQLDPQNIHSTLSGIPPITYGIVGKEFKQKFPQENQAPPLLEEGKYYRVSAPSHSANYMITTFMILDNKATIVSVEGPY